MPTVSLDSQSFSIDGKRVWLMSGSVHYARIPRALWADRLAAARDAGLNCIEAPVPWSRHEPRPGAFDFEGDHDLAEFVRMVGAMGMHCVLRAGPHIGAGYEMGGLPSWLIPICGDNLRSGTPEFLQACSRYIAALCAQIRELQFTGARKRSGPIIALMAEWQWHCGDAAAGDAYLGEIDRFFRENGVTVPLIGAHNLFHSVEGQLVAWTGRRDLHANMRQLRIACPRQPRLVAEAAIGYPALWNEPPRLESPLLAMRRVAEALAAGAQVNISPFCPGAGFSLSAGGGGTAGAGLATDLQDGAPLSASGERTDAFRALRRVCSFASSFSRLFANLDGAYQPAICSLACEVEPAPTTGKAASPNTAKSPSAGPVAVESRGSQGTVVWIFNPCPDLVGAGDVKLTLGDGTHLTVPMTGRSVGWALLDTHLVGRATLDYCNLSAFALVGSVFVCFGPAGSVGLISINQSTFSFTVPEHGEPLIESHEGITLVVCNERSIDRAFVGAGAVYVGAAGIDAAGQPIPAGDGPLTRISDSGEVSVLSTPSRKSQSRARRVAFSSWSGAIAEDYVQGTSDRYAVIDGPAEMQALGAPFGYGWFRLRLRNSASKALQAGFFEAADRLLLFLDGAPRAIVGVGPGATPDIATLALKKGEQTLTILTDNLGRGLVGGVNAERKGLFGHIYRAAAFRAGAPKVVAGAPLRILSVRAPLMGIEDGDTTDARRLTWKFQHRRKSPLFVTFDAPPANGLLLLNGATIAPLFAGRSERIALRDDALTRGGNTLQIALVGDMDEHARALKSAVKLYEGAEPISEKAEWAFARWEPPARQRFSPIDTVSAASGLPTWWRGEFTVSDTAAPLYFLATGLTKGFLYLNGHEAGRYWVGPARGRAGAESRERYYLPESWLKPGEPNELLIFDEHGKSPAKCRLTY